MATISVAPGKLSIAGIAGFKFALTLKLKGKTSTGATLPAATFATPKIVVRGRSTTAATLSPTITAATGTWHVTWTAAQTTQMAQYSGLRMYLAAKVQGSTADLGAGTLAMGQPTWPGSSTSAEATVTVDLGAVTVSVTVTIGGGGVTSFHGRAGAVLPEEGDYTAAMVGADPSGSAGAAQSNAETYAAEQASAAQAAAEAASLQKSANLSDVASVAMVRTNLGLGTAAEKSSTTFMPVGTYQKITSSGTGSVLPPGTYKFRVACGGSSGGGGGSAALTGGVSTQIGGSGGAGGWINEGSITIAVPTAPVYVIGAGAPATAGGAASTGSTGNAGGTGQGGGASSVTLGATTITSLGAHGGGSGGGGGGANSTTSPTSWNPWTGVPANTGNTDANPPGMGGISLTIWGTGGGSPTATISGGGTGGVAATSTLGGKGGLAGSLFGTTPQAVSGNTTTTSGGAGASAATGSAGGGAGGGGAAPGGAGGAGGAGGSGFIEIWRDA